MPITQLNSGQGSGNLAAALALWNQFHPQQAPPAAPPAGPKTPPPAAPPAPPATPAPATSAASAAPSGGFMKDLFGAIGSI